MVVTSEAQMGTIMHPYGGVHRRDTRKWSDDYWTRTRRGGAKGTALDLRSWVQILLGAKKLRINLGQVVYT